MIPDWTVLMGALMGALVGSFLNVVVDRGVSGRHLAYPPSACESCGARLRPWELIPVVSWAAQRGRCARCGVRLSPQYPLVELAGAALGGLAAARLGWTPLALCVFTGFMAALAATLMDLKTLRLPRRMVGIGAASLLVGAGLLTAGGQADLAQTALFHAFLAAGTLGALDALFTAVQRLFRPRRFAAPADYPLAVVALAVGAVAAPAAGLAQGAAGVLVATFVVGAALFRLPVAGRIGTALARAETPLLGVALAVMLIQCLRWGPVGVLAPLAWFGGALMALALLWAPVLLDAPRRAWLTRSEAEPQGDPVAVGFGDVQYSFVLGGLLTLALGERGLAAGALWLVPACALLAVILGILKIKRLPFGPVLLSAAALALAFPHALLGLLGY